MVYSYIHDIKSFSKTILNKTKLSIVYSYDHDIKAFSKTILNKTKLSIVYSYHHNIKAFSQNNLEWNHTFHSLFLQSWH